MFDFPAKWKVVTQGFVHPVSKGVLSLFVYLFEKRVAGSEIIIEQGSVDAGSIGDILHGCMQFAFGEKESLGDIFDMLFGTRVSGCHNFV
jgi:hypothetical protein